MSKYLKRKPAWFTRKHYESMLAAGVTLAEMADGLDVDFDTLMYFIRVIDREPKKKQDTDIVKPKGLNKKFGNRHKVPEWFTQESYFDMKVKGMTEQDICDKLKVSRPTLNRMLSEIGVKKRPRMTARRQGKRDAM